MHNCPFHRIAKSVVALMIAAALSACNGGSNDNSSGDSAASGGAGGGGSSNTSSGGGAQQLTGLDREAYDFIAARIDEHWLRTADGWTTQFQRMNIGGEVMPGRPDTLYRQLRNITFNVTAVPVSESQRLNGSDYRAEVEFATTALRQFNLVDSGMGPPGWTPWEEHYPSTIAVERRNGKWITTNSEMFEWIKPNADELAGAR